MADVSTATVIGSTTWTVFNTRMTNQQRSVFLSQYQKLGGIIDAASLPAASSLTLVGKKYKTHA